MKKSKVNEDLSSYYQRIGQEFLDGFKKLPYSTDRIGQSFIMKAGPALIQAHKTDLPEDTITSESPIEIVNRQKYRVTIKPKSIEPANEDPETAQEDMRLFLDYVKFLRAFERRD